MKIKKNKIIFVKNNMIDLIPIAKKIKENKIENYGIWAEEQPSKKENEIENHTYGGKPNELAKMGSKRSVLDISERREQNIKENEIEKEDSEFGKGLTYCLGLFIAHERDRYIFNKKPEEIPNHDSEMWFNASSDHFYDIVIPNNFPKELKDRITDLRNKCLEAGHGFTGKVNYELVLWSLTEAKELLRLIDEQFGIKTIKANYK